jgi:hypothetical protein
MCTDCELSMEFAPRVTMQLQLLVGVALGLGIMLYGKCLVLEYDGRDVVESSIADWDRTIT